MSADQIPTGGCENCGGPVRTRKAHGWVCAKCEKNLENQTHCLTLEMLKFKPCVSGRVAAIPEGGQVFDWDQKNFAYDVTPRRYQRFNVDDELIAQGPTLRSVLPELVNDHEVANLKRVAKQWRNSRNTERDLAAKTYDAIREAVAAGLSESQASKITGIDRMTIRRALGKR
jgi:hypothetical protein